MDFFVTNVHSKEFFMDFICGIENIPYAVIGSIAKKMYVEDGWMTKDIDIITTDSYEKSLRNIFKNIESREKRLHDKQFSYSRKECDVYMDLLVAQDFEDPEESCVEDAAPFNLYDVTVRIAKPEPAASSASARRSRASLISRGLRFR
jgi:hypothetical protein